MKCVLVNLSLIGCSWPMQVPYSRYMESSATNNFQRDYVKDKYKLHMLKVTRSLSTLNFDINNQVGNRGPSCRIRYFQCTI